MKKFAILLLVSFILSGFPLFSEEEKSWLLEMKSDKDLRFQGELTWQARTRMAMMFMPEQEIFLRLNATQNFLMKAQGKDGNFETESQVASASLEQYAAGQPNQKVDDEVLQQMLWVSGIGDRGAKLSAVRSPNGKILSVKGVPKKFVAYYENDMLFFPEKPVKIGDTWDKVFDHPIAVDPGQEPVICKVSVTYKLQKVDEEKNLIELKFEMSTASDHIIQNGAKVSAKMKFERTGVMKLAWPGCVPIETSSKNNISILFSPTNYVKSEEEYEASLAPVEQP